MTVTSRLAGNIEYTSFQTVANEGPKAVGENLWWTLENVASLASIVASIAVCVTALFVWRQVATQSKTALTDSRRFKRESTNFVFEALQAESFRNARDGMLKTLNKEEFIPEGRAKLGEFREVLNTYEMLAMSVALDALDGNVWKRYWKSTLLRDWERLSKFVEHERKHYNHPTLFEDTEAIVVKWSKPNSD